MDISAFKEGGKARVALIWLAGVLVVVPSIINSGSDIYRAIQNSPIGSIQKRNAALSQKHWDDKAIFKKNFEIENEALAFSRILEIRIYYQ